MKTSIGLLTLSSKSLLLLEPRHGNIDGVGKEKRTARRGTEPAPPVLYLDIISTTGIAYELVGSSLELGGPL